MDPLPHLGPFPDHLVPQPAGAHGDQPIDQVEQEADRLAAALGAAHPGGLVAADAPPVDSRGGAGEPAVVQRPGAVHLLHLVQHGAPGHLPEEAVHEVEAVGEQGRDHPVQSQPLQVRVGQLLDDGHDGGSAGFTRSFWLYGKARAQWELTRGRGGPGNEIK